MWKTFGKMSLVLAAALSAHPLHSNESRPQSTVDRSQLPPLNLTAAIQIALEKNPQALLAKESLEIAKQERGLAKGSLLPSAKANYDWDYAKNPMFLGFGRTAEGAAGVTLQQTIFNLPAILSFRASNKRLQAAADNQKNSHLKLAGTVAGSYFELLRLRITLDLANENFEFMTKLSQSMKMGDLKEKASEQDRQLVEAVLGSTLNEQHAWFQEAQMAENNLKRDGRFAPEQFFLEEPKPLPIPASPEQALALATLQSPSLLAAKARIEAARLDRLAAQKAYLPQVHGSVSGFHLHRPHTEAFGPKSQPGVMAMVGVTIPIYDPNRKSQIKIRESQVRTAELQAEEQVIGLQTALANAYIGIQERQSRIQALCESLKSRLSVLENMSSDLITKISTQDYLVQKQELFKAGVSLNTEFLAAAQDTYHVLSQTGALFENLPAPTQPQQAQTQNPYFYGLDVYRRLLNRCQEQASN